jgi:hypothetical protein
MSRHKQVRWACPNGCPGVLGPTRPRKDDVRRYCIPCSLKSGRLVERVAPTLARQRAARAEALATRRAAKAEREKARERGYYAVAGLNLYDEMRRLCRLRTFGGRSGGMALSNPTLTVRRASRPRTLGHCANGWEISVTAYPNIDEAAVRETLLHELAHAYCDRTGKGHKHDDGWRRVFRDAAEEAWGILKWPSVSYHGTYAAELRRREAP